MSRRVIIRARARHDIREIRAWYRSTSRRIADDFIARLDAAIELARDEPLAFQVVHGPLRRVILHRFPYAVFYDVTPRSIRVVAVLHHARNPELLDER